MCPTDGYRRNSGPQYCSSNNIPFELSHSHRKLKLASLVTRALGRMKILIRTSGGTIRLRVDVVPQDVPLLVGLDVMDRHRLQFLSISDHLECVTEHRRMPVTKVLRPRVSEVGVDHPSCIHALPTYLSAQTTRVVARSCP